ncbi:MAG TPA: TnsA endonuclease N-terminal domain-containing protein [Ktedonobacterales bacterium]|jgi:hypothetical protein
MQDSCGNEMPLGWITRREHELLSDLEYFVFLHLEWSQQIIDIREQFPLPLQETRAIAKTCGFAHPRGRGKDEIAPVTTDFVITLLTEKGAADQALAVKYAKHLDDNRVVEKLEIERRYWESKNIDWNFMTEHDISETVWRNVEDLHSYRERRFLYPLSDREVSDISIALTQRIVQPNAVLAEVTQVCDNLFHMPPGTSTKVARHLMANRIWQIDIEYRINPRQRLVFLESPQIAAILGSEAAG